MEDRENDPVEVDKDLEEAIDDVPSIEPEEESGNSDDSDG